MLRNTHAKKIFLSKFTISQNIVNVIDRLVVDEVIPPKVLYLQTNKERLLENGSHCQVLLTTALININDVSSQSQQSRAILDSGSHLCFITKACAKTLQLKNIDGSTSIAGIGSTSFLASRLAPALISSRISEYSTTLTFHCIPTITSD